MTISLQLPTQNLRPCQLQLHVYHWATCVQCVLEIRNPHGWNAIVTFNIIPFTKYIAGLQLSYSGNINIWTLKKHIFTPCYGYS
jgi:hypothetical protein